MENEEGEKLEGVSRTEDKIEKEANRKDRYETKEVSKEEKKIFGR